MSCAIFLNIFFNQNGIWNVHSIKEGEVIFEQQYLENGKSKT